MTIWTAASYRLCHVLYQDLQALVVIASRSLILLIRIPLKIVDIIVLLIMVFMIDLWKTIWIRDESLSNETMPIRFLLLIANFQVISDISIIF